MAEKVFFCFCLRLKGLVREGSEESPILHLRLVEPYETIEEDEDKLKEVVAIVSSVYLQLVMAANKL